MTVIDTSQIYGAPFDDFRDSLADTGAFGQVPINGFSIGNLEAIGDRDWFGVSLAAGTTYVINLQGSQAGGGTLEDPYLRLHDSTGAVLAQNDDVVSGTNRDSQVTFTASASGTYYLDAGSFNDGYTGTYKLGVTSTGSTDDFRDSPVDSGMFGQVPLNGSNFGNLEVAGDRDWFAVNLSAGTTYVINLQGLQAGVGTLEDPYLRLHDSTGALLLQNDDVVPGADRDSQVTFAVTTSGT